MAEPVYLSPLPPRRERLRHQARILWVLARTDFTFKYAGSVLGYVWSVGKPLLYFAVLYVVFDGIFRSQLDYFPLYLIIGVVLWTFLADSVTATLPSIVTRGSILRRISFPPIVIPTSATLTALFSFGINLAVVAVFLAFSSIEPSLDWLLLAPLLAELYLFVFALSLIAATLYVRFRDIGQVWEVATPVLFFSAPIVYPVEILPGWAQNVIAFNPFVQILQDVRRIILGSDAAVVQLLPWGNHLIPLAVTGGLLLLGRRLYRRDSPRFAEVA
jgi:ABC-2 type transport system permease protein